MLQIRKILEFYQQNPLSLKILGYILIISSVFAAAVAGVQLYSQYDDDIAKLENRMLDLKRSAFPSLQDSLWKLDETAIQTQINAISHLPYVTHVRLDSAEESVFQAGTLKNSENVMVRRFDLVKSLPSQSAMALGVLSVYLDLDPIYSNLLREGQLILASQAIKAFIVSLCILAILHLLLMRHLSTMSRYASNLSMRNLDHKFQLPRRKNRKPDELDKLAASLDRMRQQLADDIQELQQSQEKADRLSIAIEASPVAVALTGADGRVIYANHAFEDLLGLTADDICGRNVIDSGGDSGLPDLGGVEAGSLLTYLRSHGEWAGELSFQPPGRDRLWLYARISAVRDGQGTPTQFVVVMENFTSIREFEDKVAREENIDRLTRLPNRYVAIDESGKRLERAHAENRNVAFVLIGIPDHSQVSGAFGIEHGDLLLQACARLIRHAAPPDAIVARAGESSFLVCFDASRASNEIELFNKRISVELARPLPLNDQNVNLNIRVGVAVSPEDGKEPLMLYQNALAAQRKAETSGNAVEFFESSMNEASVRRLRIANHLKSAWRKGEVTINYQPIVRTDNHDVAGTEALVRWNSPELGFVSPPEMIGVAEQTGDIIGLGESIMIEACRQTARWLEDGHDITVAVNISPVQFLDNNFIGTITNCIETTGLPPEHLKLEITEQLLLEGSGRLRRKMEQLVRLGFQLAIDDFGTGYSSLSYLREYPFSFLKIDRAFVKDLDNMHSQYTLCKAMIDLAHNLDMQVIAEGVETERHVEILTELGCGYLQGYYFSKPKPAMELFAEIEPDAGGRTT